MRIVIVTGMSGAGKNTALKMLEDASYYCVDNLPIPLIENFIDLIPHLGRNIEQAAIGMDIRTESTFEALWQIMDRVSKKGYTIEILFMEASDEKLINRYKESRRMHPLSIDSRVEEGIAKERMLLKDIKKNANYVIDTTNLLTRELKQELDHIFVSNKEYNNLMVTIMSFGFKNGIPADADLVLDVRFLPNPYYIAELKYKTGNDKEVQDYVLSFEESEMFLVKLQDMLAFLIPNYVKEGKYQLVIAIGCTGGKHRSVTLANELYKRMKDKGEYGLKLYHRDEKQGR